MTDSNIYVSKNDLQDPRWGDLIKTSSQIEEIKNSFALLGYPDDEGVKLNGGRVGAAQGPLHIRKALYKMTPGLKRKNNKSVYDIGDIETQQSLDLKHKDAKSTVFKLLKNLNKVVTLGGGHDYGYADMSAFCNSCLEKSKIPYVINFDAHLDVRANTKSNHSGTPFYRLLSEFKKIQFLEVGIQDWCNSLTHLQWATDNKAQVILLEDVLKSNLEKLIINKYLKKFNPQKHELAISIDIDAFSSAFCPGASQVFPVGLNTQEFLIFWQKLISKFSISLLSIYEVNPTYDQDDKTAKFAALTIHQFLSKSPK